MSETTTTNTVTLEIAGLEVTLPVRFNGGMVLTDSQAKVLDAAYQRQFTNNQNASAKARVDALAAGKTGDKYAPLSATAIAALYTDYEPSVGATRTGSMEKIRQDATWRMWTAKVKSHNDNVAAHGGNVAAQTDADYVPVIAGAKHNLIGPLKPTKGPDGKVTSTVQEQRDSLITRLMAAPAYADAIQEQVDIILAEKNAAKGTDTATAATAVDMGELI